MGVNVILNICKLELEDSPLWLRLCAQKRKSSPFMDGEPSVVSSLD
jgi:hypothetical protein